MKWGKMSLTKSSFEDAKKKASKRITDWIDEAKTAGIVRLQDQYRNTFKRIEWKPKAEKPQIIDTRKKKSKEKEINPDKGKQNGNVGKIRKESLERRDERKERREDRKERKEIKQKSRRTPVSDKNTETGSRTEEKTESRADRNTDSRASKASKGSKKKYRDSANIIYGDNRNNRSSLFSSRERCSRSSIDAISLLFDDDSEQNDKPKVKPEIHLTKEIGESEYASKLHGGENKKRGKTRTKEKKGGVGQKEREDSYTYAERTYLGSNIKRGKRTRNGKQKAEINVDTSDSRTLGQHDHSDPFHFALQVASPSQLISSQKKSAVNIRLSSTSLSDEADTRPHLLHAGNQPLNRAASQLLHRAPSQLLRADNQTLTRAASQLLHRAPSQLRTPSQLFQRTPSQLLVRTASRLVTHHARSKLNIHASPSHIRRKKLDKEKSSIEIEDPEARKEFVRTKFRRLVRKLINIYTLLRGSQIKISQEIGGFRGERRKYTKDTRILFDPTVFKAASNTYGGITKRAKQALWKLPDQRTEDDIGVLMEVMYRLPFFSKYPMKVKRDLAKALWYDQFDNGRTIIKQDDPGSRMYFVISGSVSLHMTEIDPRTGIKHIRHLRDVCSGSMFGELALIRNITRTYTAICKETTEFLSLSKDEFNSVLKTRWVEDWQARMNFLKSSECFKDWPDDKITLCADHSELREYGDNKIIFGDESSLTNQVFFIRKGKAIMVKKITMVRNKSPYLRPALFLPEMKGSDAQKFLNKSYGKQLRTTRQEKHYVTVMTLLPDNYFGVGEDLKDTYIISKGKTECVVMNSASFNISNKIDSLRELCRSREVELPSNRELYHRFEINRKWAEYKKSLVREIIQHKHKTNTTTKADIPGSFLLEPRIPEDLL